VLARWHCDYCTPYTRYIRAMSKARRACWCHVGDGEVHSRRCLHRLSLHIHPRCPSVPADISRLPVVYEYLVIRQGAVHIWFSDLLPLKDRLIVSVDTGFAHAAMSRTYSCHNFGVIFQSRGGLGCRHLHPHDPSYLFATCQHYHKQTVRRCSKRMFEWTYMFCYI
jgi:hypothetical protein